MTAIQSFDGASSEEPQSDTRGSTPSLAVTGPGSNGPKRAETFSGFDTKLKPDNINRASSMRAPERPGIGFPSRQVPGAISPVVGSPKVKHKRRASGGVLPFLTKSNSKEDKEQAGTTGRLCTGKPVKTRLGPVDCKTVVSKSVKKSGKRGASHARKVCEAREKNPIFSVSPQSRSLFLASFQTFCLTACAYLNTQKFGLFCSLRACGLPMNPNSLKNSSMLMLLEVQV